MGRAHPEVSYDPESHAPSSVPPGTQLYDVIVFILGLTTIIHHRQSHCDHTL